MEHITPSQLKAWLDDASRPAPLLLDVREPAEHAICLITGSVTMPLRTVPARMNEVAADREVVVICHHGGRSLQAAMFLEANGFPKVINLTGGVAEWARQVDPSMAQY